MALIVEDGSIVPNANTYASVAALKAYAESRGIALAGDDTKLESNLIVAMDKLDSYKKKFSGKRRNGASLAWPRDDAWVDGEEWPNDKIPSELVRAQIIFATLVNSGVALFANSDPSKQTIKKKKIDVLEFEYAVPEGDNFGLVYQPVFTEAEGYLSALFGPTMTSINSSIVRA